MSQENVEAVRRIYAEWGKGNFRPKFDLYSPDLEWGWSPEFPGLAGVYRDPAERSERLREWLSPWEHWRVEAEDYITHGDHVVVLARYTGRGKAVGWTWTPRALTSGRFATAGRCDWRSSRTGRRHSTPWGCQSKPLKWTSGD